uniref:Polynucleotide phosphorylase/polyadenylase n=1 Tax=Clostridioides difficile TaxID=1496 RepID=A0A381I801_CLODI|nr:polynucleotide phosphorylase/polyadenylase [Clostridioides difficile]
MFEHKIFKMDFAGRELSVEIGKICEMASGSCIVRYSDSMVMVNTTKSAKPRDGIDFFPLSVDYEEKLYSVGKIPGGFFKERRQAFRKSYTYIKIDR